MRWAYVRLLVSCFIVLLYFFCGPALLPRWFQPAGPAPALAQELVRPSTTRTVRMHVPYSGSTPYVVLVSFPNGADDILRNSTEAALSTCVDVVVKDFKGREVPFFHSARGHKVSSASAVSIGHFIVEDDRMDRRFTVRCELLAECKWPETVEISIENLAYSEGVGWMRFVVGLLRYAVIGFCVLVVLFFPICGPRIVSDKTKIAN
jgi:hypothetical protein